MTVPQFAPHVPDVTGRVDVSDADAVCAVALGIFSRRYPGQDLAQLRQAFADTRSLYQGDYPGYLACDMPYHDLPHVLDVTLAMTRLLDGHLRSHAGPLLFPYPLALLGVVIALLHDSGYIRRVGDKRRRFGAEYTRIHVSRSARFLASYLPRLGLGQFVAVARRLVQFTGYEVDIGRIRVGDEHQRRLGHLIGTADILAQMADPGYLDKCRDRLYPEFVLGGLAASIGSNGEAVVRYADGLDLLRQTPGFMRDAIENRLDGVFGGVYRYVAVHFGGCNPYMDSIERHRERLAEVLQMPSDENLRKPFYLPS